MFDHRLVFGIDLDPDVIRHGPVNNLMVDRDIDLLILNHPPDRGDVCVASLEVGVRADDVMACQVENTGTTILMLSLRRR